MAPQSALYHTAFSATPMERIAWIRRGLAAKDALEIVAGLSMPRAWAFEGLGISHRAVARKAARDQMLSATESERVLGLAKLIGQVAAMVAGSGGAAGFNPAAWLSDWLISPLPALGRYRPLELMDTIEGQRLISNTLKQIEVGTYA